MAGPIYVNQCIKVEVVHTSSGRPVVNILHVESSGGSWSAADLLTMATAFHGYWSAQVMPELSTNITLSHVTCTDIHGPTGNTATYSASTAGSNGSTALTLQVACAISAHGLRRYRGGHSRIYFGGMCLNHLNDVRTFVQDTIDDLVAALNSIQTSLLGATYGAISPGGFAILHGRMHDHTTTPPTPIAPFIELVQTFSGDLRVDSQRRRLGKS
jgi:hypothetical protein